MARIVVITTPDTVVYVSNDDVIHIDIVGGGSVIIRAMPGETVTRFKIHFRGDDHSDIVRIDLSTFSSNDLHIDIQHYDPTDEVQLVGAFNKGVDPNNNDEFNFSFIGATGGTFNGFVHAKDGNEDDFNADPSPVVICFAGGTIIDTDLGPRPVESITEGDLVVTQDNGLQPVRWIGSRRLDSIDLMRHPQFYPIRIAAGAMGGGLPYCDLTLSPQHRVQLCDWRAEYLFAESKVLVAAKHLVDGARITVDDTVAAVTYCHLLFDRHEIVFADGIEAESFRPGPASLAALSDEARAELHAIYPDLADAPDSYGDPARALLRRWEGELLVG